MFNIHWIELEGIFSIDQFQFDFEQNKGKTLVVGQNKDEFASSGQSALKDATATISNESGKTNFFDAIEEHFTGGTPKGLKNDGIINVFTDTGSRSQVKWSSGPHTYLTSKFRNYRGRNGDAVKKNGIFIERFGESGIEDLTKKRILDNEASIQTLFPYDLTEFRSLVYVPASEVYPLLLPDSKATAKRRLMNTIYRLHYEDFLKECRRRKTDMENAIEQLKARMSGEIESLEEQLHAIGDVCALREALEKLPESQLKALENQIEALSQNVQKATALRDTIEAMARAKEAYSISDPLRERSEAKELIDRRQQEIAASKTERQQLDGMYRILKDREHYLSLLHGYVEQEQALYAELAITPDDSVSKLLTNMESERGVLANALPRYAERDLLQAQAEELRGETVGSHDALQKQVKTLEHDLEIEDRCIDIYSKQKAFVLQHIVHFDSEFDEGASNKALTELNEDAARLLSELDGARLQAQRAEQGTCPTCGRPFQVECIDAINAKIADLSERRKDTVDQLDRARETHQFKRDALRAYRVLPTDAEGNPYELLDSGNRSLLSAYEHKLVELRAINQKRRRVYENLSYALGKAQELKRFEASLADYGDLDRRKAPQIQAEIQRLDDKIQTAKKLKEILVSHRRDYAKWEELNKACQESQAVSDQVQTQIQNLDITMETQQAQLDGARERLHVLNNFVQHYGDVDPNDPAVLGIENALQILQALRVERDQFIAQRSEIQSQVELATRLERSIEESRSKQNEINDLRRKQQIWHTLTFVFGAAGLPKEKIQEITHQINERIKVYAPIIFHRPRQIYLEVGENGAILLRQTKGGHIMKSTTNSSGGRIKTTAAVLFSLRDTLPPSKKSPLLILDEFDLNLDEISALRILDALDVHIARSNVENVLMTSHKTLLRNHKGDSGSTYWDRILLATMQNEITTYSIHAA